MRGGFRFLFFWKSVFLKHPSDHILRNVCTEPTIFGLLTTFTYKSERYQKRIWIGKKQICGERCLLARVLHGCIETLESFLILMLRIIFHQLSVHHWSWTSLVLVIIGLGHHCVPPLCSVKSYSSWFCNQNLSKYWKSASLLAKSNLHLFTAGWSEWSFSYWRTDQQW